METIKNCDFNKSIQLVSTDFVYNHLDDKDVLIIDTQPNLYDYILEHLPNAVYLNESLFTQPMLGLPSQFVSLDAVKEIFRRIGLSKKSVVVYSGLGSYGQWGDGLEHAMVAYAIARFGHQNVYLMDGGIDKWARENKPLTQDFPLISEEGFTPKLRKDFFIDMQDVKKSIEDEDTIILDSRLPGFFLGAGPCVKNGHIPGAINIPWQEYYKQGNPYQLKSIEIIQNLFLVRGVTQDKNIICSSCILREATLVFIILKYMLQYPNVKLYEGSFLEWSSYPENEILNGFPPEHIDELEKLI